MKTAEKPELFLTWVNEQFDVGIPDPKLVWACEAYIQGLLDAKGPDDNKANLYQVQGVLKSLRVILDQAKQHEVRMP